MALADQMIHTVSVEAVDQPPDDAGMIAEDWQPVSGQGAVPCRVMMTTDAAPMPVADRVRPEVLGYVMFAAPVGLGPRHRLVWIESPDATHYLYCQGTVPVQGMGRIWIVRVVEYPSN